MKQTFKCEINVAKNLPNPLKQKKNKINTYTNNSAMLPSEYRDSELLGRLCCSDLPPLIVYIL